MHHRALSASARRWPDHRTRALAPSLVPDRWSTIALLALGAALARVSAPLPGSDEESTDDPSPAGEEAADSLDELRDEAFLDTAPPPAQDRYRYGTRSSNDSKFVAQVQRIGSRRWKGRITIDQAGELGGKIKAKGGQVVKPVKR